jgi:hypothetical protein
MLGADTVARGYYGQKDKGNECFFHERKFVLVNLIVSANLAIHNQQGVIRLRKRVCLISKRKNNSEWRVASGECVAGRNG